MLAGLALNCGPDRSGLLSRGGDGWRWGDQSEGTSVGGAVSRLRKHNACSFVRKRSVAPERDDSPETATTVRAMRGVVSFMLSVWEVRGRRGGGGDKDTALCCLGIDVESGAKKGRGRKEEKWEGSWFCKTISATVATTLLFIIRQWRGGCAGRKQAMREVAFLSGAHS